MSHPIMLVLFILTATQPYSMLIGPLLIGPYRLVLMILSIPLILGWVRGRYGGFVAPDFLILAYVIWISIALAANGQANRVTEYGSAQVFDIFVAYLLGRAAVRTKRDFYFFAKCFLLLLLFLLPFAFLESTRGMMILQGLFRNLPSIRPFNPTTLVYPQRLGLMRAMTTINHPIVYGVFCSLGFSLGFVGMKYYKGGQNLFKRSIWSAGAAGGVFFSLSAGALAGVAIQSLLIVWNRVLAALTWRWYLLGGISTVVYIIIDIIAVRPPLLVLARYVAFSGSTAWNRYLIWQFGIAEVWRNPIFGMGLFSDWQRARWMTPSIDNHWLLVAMRFGLPGLAMLLTAYFYILTRLVRQDFSHDQELSVIRFSFVFTFIGLFFSFATVNGWHITYSLCLMMMGAAVWIFNEPHTQPGAGQDEDGDSVEADPAPRRRQGPVYTRFPGKPANSRVARRQAGS